MLDLSLYLRYHLKGLYIMYKDERMSNIKPIDLYSYDYRQGRHSVL